MLAIEPRAARRRQADVAYACYGWIAIYLAFGAGLQAIFGRPADPAALARWQGIGMLVLLPLAITALAAAVVGVKNSLALVRLWPTEAGLYVSPILLGLLLAAFLLNEADRLPRSLLYAASLLYVIVALALAVRWFVARRQRAAFDA